MVAADAPIYRSVLRLCRGLDRHPLQLAALLGRPARRYNPALRKLVNIPRSSWPFVDDAVREASGKSSEYTQPAGHATAAARLHRRRLAATGISYKPDAEELLCRLQKVRDLNTELSDLFSLTLMELDSSVCQVIELPKLNHMPPDCSEEVEVGELLIAHPLACLFQPELDQAVVLVDEVDDESGSVHGIVLNKPEGVTLREAMTTAPPPEEVFEPLLDAELYVGGDLVAQEFHFLERIRWLHPFGPNVLPGACELLPGIFLGGDLEKLAALVGCGDIDVARLRPMLGFVGWECTQLELELERGVWIRTRTPSGVSCNSFLDAVTKLRRVQAEAAANSESIVHQHSKACCSLLWRAALQSSGFASLAMFPRAYGQNKLEIDNRLIQWVEEHSEAQMQELLALHGATSSGQS